MGSCCGQNAQETSIHWKHVMSPLHFISGDRWQHNIHCPFSPSAQICSQANRTRDHGPPNVYKHLPKKSPFPKLKEQHSWICSTRSSPGTLFFKKAKKPCVESHGREPTLKSNKDEKMRRKWWICPCCSNWILKHQFMRMRMQTVLTNKQKPSHQLTPAGDC